MLVHCTDQVDGARNVDAVVLCGDLGGLSHSLDSASIHSWRDRGRISIDLQGGKVNDRVNLRVLCKDGIQRRHVRHVDLVEDGTATAEQLNAVQSLDRRVVEVIDNDNVVAGDEELEGGEGADVARSTRRRLDYGGVE